VRQELARNDKTKPIELLTPKPEMFPMIQARLAEQWLRFRANEFDCQMFAIEMIREWIRHENDRERLMARRTESSSSK
jgi:hypothetical protein